MPLPSKATIAAAKELIAAVEANPKLLDDPALEFLRPAAALTFTGGPRLIRDDGSRPRRGRDEAPRRHRATDRPRDGSMLGVESDGARARRAGGEPAQTAGRGTRHAGRARAGRGARHAGRARAGRGARRAGDFGEDYPPEPAPDLDGDDAADDMDDDDDDATAEAGEFMARESAPPPPVPANAAEAPEDADWCAAGEKKSAAAAAAAGGDGAKALDLYTAALEAEAATACRGRAASYAGPFCPGLRASPETASSALATTPRPRRG